MGRDAAGVIGIRLARKGDQVVGMGVVQPGDDILVLTETGYGKRVAPARASGPSIAAARASGSSRSRAPRPAQVAAVELVDETDEELLLISAGGQVVRTDVKSVNRYSSAARGVIVMRLNEGDSVAGIAVFRAGLAEQRGIDHNDGPGRPPTSRWRRDTGVTAQPLESGSRVTSFGFEPVEPRHRRDASTSTPATPTRELARKIARYLDVDAGPVRGVRVRQREHLRQDPGQRPRARRLPRPADLLAGPEVDHGAADHDRRLQARERRAHHGRRALLRLRPLGQEGPAARAHHGAPHRGHDQRRGRRPAAHDGPPPGPDPGLLQHPGRRADRRPPALATTSSRSDLEDLVVVTDLGFAKRARTFAEILDAPLAIIEKRRHGNDDRAEVLNVIGEVKGKRAIIVDDEIDTAGTLMEIDPRAGARRRHRDLRLRHPRRAVRSGDRPHPRLRA